MRRELNGNKKIKIKIDFKDNLQQYLNSSTFWKVLVIHIYNRAQVCDEVQAAIDPYCI